MGDAGASALILVFALILFASEKVRHDLVAVAALLACLAFGLVGPEQALSGFSDPAVVTVAGVLILGRAIELSGAAAAASRRLIPRHASFSTQLAVLMALGAVLSAFMNNIAALIVTMPLAAQIARSAGRAPGAALMPLAFATILGGMTTLIGTPANLILSSVREDELGEPFSFFAMTGVGSSVAITGLVYLSVVGWRLIPIRKRSAREAGSPWRVFELEYADGANPPAAAALRAARARLLAVFRGGTRVAGGDLRAIAPGDRLLVLSRCSQWEVAERTGLAPTAAKGSERDAVTARVVVAHGSPLISQGYEAVHALSGGTISVIGGGPRTARLRQPLATIRIQAGDQLYIRGSSDAVGSFARRARLLELDRLDPAPLDVRRAAAAVAIFSAAMAATVSGAAAPSIAFFAGAAAVAALRLVSGDEIYRTIDWSVIVLLAAMIPVGGAFNSSGAAEAVAQALGDALTGAPVFFVLAALCAGTMALSIFLNNVATAIVMGPIAIRLGDLLAVSPDSMLLAVLIGASSDFLTPIGHHNNLLVMGPGGYLFTDYARVGAALVLLVVMTSAAYLALSG